MFTGIIEEIGVIRNIKRRTKSTELVVSAKKVIEDLRIGDSVAINGVCLTVTNLNKEEFCVDVMSETLTCSTLGRLSAGSNINLERAIAVNGRLGGHIVSGHVDGVGKIIKIHKEDIAIWYTVSTQPKIMHYIIEKGSIAIDGISLTIARVDHNSFSISIIPHTTQKTILSEKRIGDCVNLENDLIGKYVQKFIGTESSVNKEFLIEHGF